MAGDGTTPAAPAGPADEPDGPYHLAAAPRPPRAYRTPLPTPLSPSPSASPRPRDRRAPGTLPGPGARGATGGGVPDLDRLVTLRAHHPEAVAEAAARRRTRPLLRGRDRLLIVAADHPARGSLAVGDRPYAMANRTDLLRRLCLALSRPGVDGVLASADVLDDLLLLGALDDRLAIGSMNRGGLAGASFELDDRFTGHRPQDLARLGFDAGKLLLRIDPDDPGSLRTLHSAARAVDEMAALRLPVFVEPFLCRRDAAGLLHNDLSAEAVTTSLAVASGLGGTSAYTWLKVPVTDDPDAMARVMETTTLPAVLLGGDPGPGRDAQEQAYEKWRGALRLPTVRGLVVGRTLLYPADGDVAGAVDTAASLL
ncbi:deoxyribose-phosphate aldolase [Streptomyces sp. NPDC006460]|uniref:Cgl0159 family (beta/alpha)8-fold protein n=1 Tax=Streptomyces sp. NPDC006460 TaxID=3154304 RepID=UPI0033A9FDDF